MALAFSTRRGGISAPPYASLNLGRSTEDHPDAVAENRRRFLETLGLAPSRLATAGQVHGDRAVLVQEPGLHHDCDALITAEPGIALAVTAADCLPILYTAANAVAAAHSGWRGSAAGTPRSTLRALCALSGSSPADVDIHLGPCIRACCYVVGPEVADQFPSAAVCQTDGVLRLDLVTAARLQLLEAGVPSDRIHQVPACTACEPEWYFSHRRDGGRTGRHWAVAALRE